MKYRYFYFVLLISIFTSCTPVSFLNGITPSKSYLLEKNVSYGSLGSQVMDIYQARAKKENSPIIVFIHGGSWDSGSKDIYKFFAEGFTSEGYDVAVPNYRLFPEIIFPDMLHDTAKAVAYLSNLFSNRKVVLIGHSAGGYNALMVSMNKHYLKEQGISVCSLISGVVSISSPTGVYELKKEPLVTIFPDRFKYNDAPMAYVDNATPSLLVINGLADKVVDPQNAIILSEKVNKRGGQSVLKLYPDTNHTQAVQVMSRYFDDNISLKSDILNFIDELPRDGNHCY